MRIAITGSSGMLGKALTQKWAKHHELLKFSGSPAEGYVPVDLCEPSTWKNLLLDFQPDVVVNTAAATNVDTCEKNPDFALQLNGSVPGWLAEKCHHLNAQFVQISTDAVFDGTKDGSYLESDPVNPLNIYGQSKLMGEREALKFSNSLVLRTNIFGTRGKAPLSFGEWVHEGLKNQTPLTMFTDVYFSPLFVGDLADLIERAFQAKLTGLFHAGSHDFCSKYEFAIKMAESWNLTSDNVQAIKVADKGLTAKRANNMVLNSSKIEQKLKFTLPTIEEGLIHWKDANNG